MPYPRSGVLHRLLIASAIALCLLGAHRPADADPVVQTWPDGTEKERYEVDAEGRKHGSYLETHANGQVAIRATWKHGVLHGLHKSYDEQGHLRVQATYRDGVLHGAWKQYHENDRLEVTATYKDGKLHGAWHLRGPDGATRVKTSYEDGLLDGSYRAWDGKHAITKQTWRAGVPTDVDGIAPYPRPKAQLVKEIQRLLAGDGRLAADPLEADRELALRYLKAYRCISGVPYADIEINPGFQMHAQAAAEVCSALGAITHFPKNPGWDPTRFQFAAIGTKSSNLAQGRIACDSIRAYMDDSDERNIGRVGHRAWCMNPAMTRTGFGTVDRFSAMWSISSERKDVADYEFVSCPPAGHAPGGWFGEHWAWSVSLNPKRFDAPAANAVRIEVVPVEETFLPSGAPLVLENVSVLDKSAGIPYMLVFRPVGVSLAEGLRYRVTVEGLQHKGKPTTLRYYVDFFDFAYVPPQLPADLTPASVLSR